MREALAINNVIPSLAREAKVEVCLVDRAERNVLSNTGVVGEVEAGVADQAGAVGLLLAVGDVVSRAADGLVGAEDVARLTLGT